MPINGYRPTVRQIVGTLGVLALAFHIAHGQLGLGGRALNTFSYDWVYDGVIIGAAIACLIRAWRVPSERLAWFVLGAGLASDAVGEMYYTLAFGNSGNPPIPSLADLFYLLYYPAMYAGLVLLVRARIDRLSRSTWLDGGIAATTSAAVIAAVAFEAIVRGATHQDPAAVATTLAYPVGDLILLAIVVGMFGLAGWRPGRAWLLLGLGLGLAAVADTAYLYASAHSTYVVGDSLDSMWIASALAIGFAAWQPASSKRTLAFEGTRLLLVPGASALIALGLLLYGGFHHVGSVALGLAGGAMLLVIVRFAWTFRENLGLLESSRADSLTDALTGLGNRRALTTDLDRAMRDGAASTPGTLLLFDLDGFKLYNDSFGHLAGDTMLAHLGGRLRVAVGAAGVAYRLGGDEFCALLYCDGSHIDAHVSAAVAALGADGEGFAVGCSYGRVAIPREAENATHALRLADDRMYAHKGGRAGSARQQTHNVLLGLLRERHPDLHEHLQAVGRTAVVIGRKLKMNEEELDELRRAAELHDVGKSAIPDAIINKPEPLDAAEMAFMRRHTLVGERILAAAPAMAPVAPLVRSSHERWDGTGYPDRLAGTEIALGARIVSVCDAFDAMVSERPYAKAMEPADALAELRRCASSQFDPTVVAAFEQAWEERGALFGSVIDARVAVS